MPITISGSTGIAGVDGSAGTPAVQGTDTNTGIAFPAADTIAASTGGSERLRINSSGNVGIGTSSPAYKLDINSITGWAANNTAPIANIVGANAPTNGGGNLRILSNTSATADAGGSLVFGGYYTAQTNSVDYAEISGRKQTGQTTGGYLAISTRADLGNETERLRIDSSGNFMVAATSAILGVGNTNTGFGIEKAADGTSLFISRANNVPVYVNRNDDGQLISFQESGVPEGSISVSGTTVSYNGGHLARWSQLLNGARDPVLLKGTVLSNLDEMCEWLGPDGQQLPNEQLNKMKISDVEGDPNVAGIFVNWDNDDQTYTDDMNVAMTGDMIIRIAQGVVVQKGDLLTSAGDGTAKPQGDDIRRSKTVAKVTSNHVTCTYADGSYCVPCVLMAC